MGVWARRVSGCKAATTAGAPSDSSVVPGGVAINGFYTATCTKHSGMRRTTFADLTNLAYGLPPLGSCMTSPSDCGPSLSKAPLGHQDDTLGGATILALFSPT